MLLSKGMTGFFIGTGVTLAAPKVIPLISEKTRPFLKSMVKEYLILERSVKDMTSRGRAYWKDLVAEVRAEQEAAAKAQQGEASGAAPSQRKA